MLKLASLLQVTNLSCKKVFTSRNLQGKSFCGHSKLKKNLIQNEEKKFQDTNLELNFLQIRPIVYLQLI